MIRPFDYSGITRDARGIAHYDNRPGSLVEMLRATVERSPDHEAIVEIGGARAGYRELWERAARVSGGLRAQGVGGPLPQSRSVLRWHRGTTRLC